ncbi:hypothetical protein KP509_14G041900 [Ceratopteris richardii]|uniref:Uncharacterized protein n=1 Tax=Ceratopteris richardii TaxID=49495 RepID=A0A8T2TE96_CERRI|nr:hypothetical protein KP509_14G041900 [Ceratopteris richardii]
MGFHFQNLPFSKFHASTKEIVLVVSRRKIFQNLYCLLFPLCASIKKLCKDNSYENAYFAYIVEQCFGIAESQSKLTTYCQHGLFYTRPRDVLGNIEIVVCYEAQWRRTYKIF